MFQEHTNTIWGTYCDCGSQCSILQSDYHPWDDGEFIVKLRCDTCNKEIIVNKDIAKAFYDKKIYSYFKNLHGTVVDLGCGGGFLSRYLLKNRKVKNIYGLDLDFQCNDELSDIIQLNPKFQFFCADAREIEDIFYGSTVDFLVSRDVFMFIENTKKYFDDVTSLTKKGIKHMGWYMEKNQKMKNKLLPEQIADEYRHRGWTVDLEYLDWYKSGYFINAYKECHES